MDKKSKMNSFSVGLGLFDYINPVFYAITSITLIKNLYQTMDKNLFVIMVIGCIISMIFGLSIPTLKFIVGLGKVKFKMPVNLVFYVNTGLLITGLALLKHTLSISTSTILVVAIVSILLLGLIYSKTKKFNTVAVLIGLIGYSFIHISLITYAINYGYTLSIVLYAIAIVLQIFLVLLGCFSNLKLPRVHWTIEITNVCCQGVVAISTILLFNNIM